MERKKIHYNIPQLMSMLVDAPEEWHVIGRGTGKTEGILATKSTNRIKEMPRSTQIIIGATFQQILTRTLPPLVAGWERLGYRLGNEYLVGVRPPEKWRKKWNWVGPYRPPFKWEYVLSFYNGAVFQLVSQDRIGSTNGMSVDGIIGDEAKLLNRERLHSETIPANRGIIKDFENNPQHHYMCFTTDMPIGSAGRWILDKETEMDTTKVSLILKLQGKVQDLKLRLLELKTAENPKSFNRIKTEINLLKKYIQYDLRKGLVFFQEASTLSNIHAVGIDYIRSMMRNLSGFDFETSILNRRPSKLEDGFYPDLNEEHHGYFAYDYHHFENIGYDFQRLKEADNASIDSDYDTNSPLHISLDYNRRICPIVVAQIHDTEIRIINGIFEKYPSKLRETLKAFCTYYTNHKRKMLYFWYDHTATAEYAHANSQSDEVISYLRSNGWTVIERYIGKASSHERRYTMWGHLLKEDGFYKFTFKYNRERAKYLGISMNKAGTEYKRQGFGKNKTTEQDKNFPAEESTHFSEAADMLVWGILESGLSIQGESPTSLGILYR